MTDKTLAGQFHREEHQLLVQVLRHPAGYDVDLFGVLMVRSIEGGWAVTFDPPVEMSEPPWEEVCGDPEAAVTLFLAARHRLRLGSDHEDAGTYRLEWDGVQVGLGEPGQDAPEGVVRTPPD